MENTPHFPNALVTLAVQAGVWLVAIAAGMQMIPIVLSCLVSLAALAHYALQIDKALKERKLKRKQHKSK